MKINNTVKLIIALVIPQIFAILGSIFTQSSVSTWYPLLEKPFFNPPSWLFAPVWIILYILMGIAAFLIWKKDLKKKETRFLVLIFVFQLALNLFWSYLFFFLKNPGIAFTEIISLWFAILATVIAFYQYKKWAAYLLIPYLLWVSFAMVLNYSIWQLNGGNMYEVKTNILTEEVEEGDINNENFEEVPYIITED
jgi:tryptophan-rich sensory protein